jgi:hypothetical protein
MLIHSKENYLLCRKHSVQVDAPLKDTISVVNSTFIILF